MELVQDKISGQFSIQADGFHATNSEDYFNHTDLIGSWVIQGLSLTDGKVVKANVKRIVELQAGANLDAKLLSLGEVDLIKLAGQELLFDLIQSTLVPTYMDLDQYNDSRLYRQKLSAEARARRWNAMLKELTSVTVLANPLKIAFLAEELKKFKDDYVIADNKVFEYFINGVDHPLHALGYRTGVVDFATAGKGLGTLALWDVGGADQPYKDLVTGIILGCIINAEHYVS